MNPRNTRKVLDQLMKQWIHEYTENNVLVISKTISIMIFLDMKPKAQATKSKINKWDTLN